MNMKKITILAGLALVFAGCYNDKSDKLYPTPSTTTCDTTAITYSTDVLPIITTYCNTGSSCHSSGSTSGYDFSTYAGLNDVANVDLLLNDINGTPSTGHSAMPKNSTKLSDCNINKITRWVNLGALNN